MQKTLIIPPGKVGLVLGGGGFFGSFQVGVLEVLSEYGIPIEKVAGTSVGAIAGAEIVASNFSAAHLKNIWLNGITSPDIVFDRKAVHKIFLGDSVFRIEPLLNLIGGNLDLNNLLASDKEFIATTTHIPSGKVVYFSNKDPLILEDPIKMLLAIVASCAIPVAFPLVKIVSKDPWNKSESQELTEQFYIDGAYRRPLPIKKMIELLNGVHDGCNTVIVVRCHSDKIMRPMPKRTHERILYSQGISHNGKEKDEIAYIREKYAGKINLIVIEPDFFPSTLGTLSFKKGDFWKAIAEGRRVAIRELEHLLDYFSNNSAGGNSSVPPPSPLPPQGGERTEGN